MAEFIGFIIALIIISAYWFFLMRAAVASGIKKAKADERKDTLNKMADYCIKECMKEKETK